MRSFLFAALSFCTVSLVQLHAQKRASPEAPAANAEATPKIDLPGINLTHGPATVKLGRAAELKLPARYAFVGPDSLDKFFERTQNKRSGKEVGVVLSPEGWLAFFDYDEVGYVKDDEKNDLKADDIYKSMEKGIAANNEDRKKRGWDEHKLQGWATKPHYDEKTHNLKWAFRFSSSADQFKHVVINEHIRLLGRGGIMKVTLVSDTDSFKASEASADRLLTDFSYVSGQKYAEFKSGDKIAQYGLAALVVGGAGAVALKTGLLAQLGVFLAKSWKFVVFGAVALVAGLSKLWKKIAGRDQT